MHNMLCPMFLGGAGKHAVGQCASRAPRIATPDMKGSASSFLDDALNCSQHI